MKKSIEFWFEFGSTYSYLSAMRVDDVAASFGVKTIWRPFLLGPIFTNSGWQTSPFNIYPEKGEYMWRDVARRAEKYGLMFRRLPDEGECAFPQNGLYASRIALIGLTQDWGRKFCKSVFASQFAQGENIADIDMVQALALDAGAVEKELLIATSEENKSALRYQTENATQLGIFGAPSFLAGDELFWGDDRLEDALEYSLRQ